jgi:hypothetical protein
VRVGDDRIVNFVRPYPVAKAFAVGDFNDRVTEDPRRPEYILSARSA